MDINTKVKKEVFDIMESASEVYNSGGDAQDLLTGIHSRGFKEITMSEAEKALEEVKQCHEELCKMLEPAIKQVLESRS